MIASVAVAVPDAPEIADLGRRIYRDKYQAAFEAHHLGQIVAIEVESQRAFLGNSVMETLEHAQRDLPDGLFHIMRVGFPGVYRLR